MQISMVYNRRPACLSIGSAISSGRHDAPCRIVPYLLSMPAFSAGCAGGRWVKDDLGIPSFARLGELVVLPVAAFDGRYDVWTIDAELSPGCGSPELPEEVML